jgi:polysaccharide biosynthesis/export protein
MFSCVSLKKQKFMQDRYLDKNLPVTIKSYAQQEPIYTLKADDLISVEVFSLTQEKFNFLGNTPKLELTVDRQGNIELPVVGNLKVTGMTLEQVQEKIKTLTTDYLKSPKVTVKLLNFSYTVLGEVNSQGSFQTTNTTLNILEALGQAGGLTEYANRSTIRILRHEQSAICAYTINILEDDLLLSDRYFIQPGDVILVDPLRVKNTKGNINYISLGVSLGVSLITTLSFLLFRN